MRPLLIPCPPPSRFTPAGEVYEVHVSSTPPSFIKPRKRTGRRAQGVRYENKTQEYLVERYGDSYIRSPWLHFRSDNGWRWCQPDGVLLQPQQARLVVVEIKYQHTSDAWWQLERLYKPVLRRLFNSEWAFDSCEIVKWFDGAIAFPCRPTLCEDVARVPPGDFGVHIYKPRGGG